MLGKLRKLAWLGSIFAVLALPLFAQAQTILEVGGGAGGAGGNVTDSAVYNGEAGSDYTVNDPLVFDDDARIAPEPGGASTDNKGGQGGKGEGLYFVVSEGFDITTFNLTGGAGGVGGYSQSDLFTGGDAGAGGSISMEIMLVPGTFIKPNIFTGGQGGQGGEQAEGYGAGGNGGKGGDVNVTLSVEVNFSNGGVTLNGGQGGASGDADTFNGYLSGAGGAGGNVTFNINAAPVNFGALTAKGGDGGGYGQLTDNAVGSIGGKGGDVTITITAETQFTGDAEFSGGAGGTGTTGPYFEDENSGNGGNVTITATADTFFEGALSLTGGDDGGNNAGAGKGGDVIFDALQNTVVLRQGAQIITGAGTNTETKATVSFRAQKVMASGGLTLIDVGPADIPARLIFRVDELQAIGNLVLTGANIYGTTGADSDGVYIGQLTIGDMTDPDNPIFGVAVTINTAAGLRKGYFGFGGKLHIIGLSHNLIGADRLGQISSLTFDLPNENLDMQTLLFVDQPLNIEGAAISINAVPNDYWQDPTSIVLVDHVSNGGEWISENITAPTGLATEYSFLLNFDGNDGSELVAIFAGEQASAEANSSFSMAAGAFNLLQLGGRDLLSRLIGTGQVIGRTNQGGNIEMLAGFAAATEKFELNSEIQSKRFNLAVGPAVNLDLLGGTALLGAFFEAGWSSYDVINNPPEQQINYNGDGEVHYLGAGLLAGLKLDSGLHVDASLAYGRISNQFSPYWLEDSDFEIKTNYLSAHLTAGYLIPLSEKQGLDIYGKLLWYRQQATDAWSANGEFLQLDAFSSLRSVLGVNYQFKASDMVELYAGLGWEYQFKAEQMSYVNDLAMTPAVFQGHSLLLTLGANLRPMQRVSVGLDLQGALGQRQGLGCKLTVGFEF